MSGFALGGGVVSGGGVREGYVVVEGGRVTSVGPQRPAVEVVEFPGHYIVPGFVDLQVNGAFGVDVATAPQRLPELSAKLISTGVTSYLPTLISLPLAEYPPLLKALDLTTGSGALAMGLHLEGPFLNPRCRGAHLAENISAPDDAALEELMRSNIVSLVTLAPELEGAGELIRVARRHGSVVSAGHSEADFKAALGAFEAGATSVTHLFNAMGALHHRHPGLAGAALSHAGVRCGVICDGRHVHPAMVSLAYRLLGPRRMYLVTDAIAAAGMGEGEYSLAGRSVGLRDGIPRLKDGTLAGSVLTMDEAVRNVIRFTGCSLSEAVEMASTTPARLVGVEEKGELSPGKDADIVVLSPELAVRAVWVRGERVFG